MGICRHYVNSISYERSISNRMAECKECGNEYRGWCQRDFVLINVSKKISKKELDDATEKESSHTN